MRPSINLPALLTLVLASLQLSVIVHAAEAPSASYHVRPGDTLIVTAWKEPDLSLEVLVRPDGKFSFPLAGDIQAAGRAPEEIRADVVKKIESFIPEVAVTVMVKDINGNKAYVIGKVQRPGPILMTEPTNVMQALSIAGGTVQFANLKRILILRSNGAEQSAIPFNYNQVEDGEDLGQNVILAPGDVIVVP